MGAQACNAAIIGWVLTFGNLKGSACTSFLPTLQYTLRYSGGLVPDLHHIVAKVKWAALPCGQACSRGR